MDINKLDVDIIKSLADIAKILEKYRVNLKIILIILGVIMILIIHILLFFKIMESERNYKYKVEIQANTYYTNTVPKIYNSGKCIEIISKDKIVLNFCNSTFVVRN